MPMMPNYSSYENLRQKFVSFCYKYTFQKFLLLKNKNKNQRFLEIGPGEYRISGFETINSVKNKVTDYVHDVEKIPLPFENNSFDIIYASHILEHVPWYMNNIILSDWYRIIKPGGFLEIFVPDALKIAKAFVDYEEYSSNEWLNDGWFRYNEDNDPAVWFNGRIFSYGDGKGTKGHRNWHLSCYSPRLLRNLLLKSNFVNLVLLSSSDVRGYDHGWINLGYRAFKNCDCNSFTERENSVPCHNPDID